MQPVWVLSVDLQTRTATFQSGLRDAASAARGAFGQISSGASGMGAGVGKASVDVRHSLGLVDNVIRGAHAQAMADLVRMYAQSALVMSTLPVAAAAAGIALIGGIAYEAAEHVEKLKEAHEKLANDITNSDTVGNNAFRQLDDRILEAGIQADELSNNHLGALQKRLRLIDDQNMDDLIKQFDTLAKAADTVFADLAGNWYSFGQGSDGAKHALAQFHVQYAALIAAGKSEQASGLLHGTLDQAQKILTMMQQFAAQYKSSDLLDVAANRDLLKQAGGNGDYDQRAIQAQQQIVQALQEQVGIEQRLGELKKLDSSNATRQAGNEDAARRAEAARQAAQSMQQMGEQAVAADKAAADAKLSIQRASLEQRLASDIEFAGRERDVQLAGNAAEVAALDKSGKDYANQLKALQDKALGITSEYEAKVAELRAKASEEIANRDLAALEQHERETIDATREGSAARLAAIDAAIKDEQAAHMQDMGAYKELLTQRVETVRQMAEQEATIKADAAKEAAADDEKMGELHIAAEKQRMATQDSGSRPNANRQIAEATKIANDEYAIKMAALKKQEAGLDASGKDYQNKLKQIQDQEKQLVQQHENEITAIKEKAEQERNERVLSAENSFNNAIAAGLTKSIMGRESWAKMSIQLGQQVVSGMIENAIKSMLADDLTKEKDAAYAARKAFNIGINIGGPAGMILGPAFAAAAFTAVMAFQGGGIVPGVGGVDSVPAMLTPGEGVVPKGVMEGLSSMARNGGFNQQGQTVHVHVRPTYHVNTIDGDGMKAALEKHSDQLQRHFERSLRKMNR